MSLMKDFKAFALKGNVVDLAIAVVIGAAFGRVVTSLVNDIIMPIIGTFTGGIDFSKKKVIFSHAVLDAAGKVVKPENALTYGNFINAIIMFLIISFSIFIVMRGFIKLQKKQEEAPAPPAPTAEVTLLTEIRDLLKR
ncbi:MAG TPA: large-conductance mechanosensitive channel protein MscL [Chitinophagaceae bacterium]|jgi:large conductance mechanosensitive channel|nr:large-conductance mechanosensitive channel protein MscL [Chitinophagaceae bacterium]